MSTVSFSSSAVVLIAYLFSLFVAHSVSASSISRPIKQPPVIWQLNVPNSPQKRGAVAEVSVTFLFTSLPKTSLDEVWQVYLSVFKENGPLESFRSELYPIVPGKPEAVTYKIKIQYEGGYTVEAGLKACTFFPGNQGRGSCWSYDYETYKQSTFRVPYSQPPDTGWHTLPNSTVQVKRIQSLGLPFLKTVNVERKK